MSCSKRFTILLLQTTLQVALDEAKLHLVLCLAINNLTRHRRLEELVYLLGNLATLCRLTLTVNGEFERLVQVPVRLLMRAKRLQSHL